MAYAAVHDESSHQPIRVMDGYEKLTVAAAAARLGASQDAIRKRIQRDTIKWDKDDSGRVYVYLYPSEPSQAADQDAVQAESETTVEVLRDQLTYLQEIIRTRDEEIRRHQHLLAAALERIPALEEATPEPREAPETGSDLRPGVDPQGDDAGADTDVSRPWWRRVFGA